MRIARFVLLLTLIAEIPATAQVRTFVSANGLDSNPCSRTQPCRNFGAAAAVVDSGGEVVALDSAGYGAVVLTDSVSLIAPAGIHAAIAPTSGLAIEIHAGSGTVRIRGLYLNSQGASVGVAAYTGSVHVENLVVNGFTVTGIGTILSPLFISDTVIRNGGVGSAAIHISPQSVVPLLRVIVDRVVLSDSDFGVRAEDGANVSIRDSVAINNEAGFAARAEGAGTTAAMTIDNCAVTGVTGGFSAGIFAGSVDGDTYVSVSNTSVAFNAVGVYALGTALLGSVNLRLSDCTLTRNGTGIQNSGGFVESRGNNFVSGNGTETTGVISFLAGQ